MQSATPSHAEGGNIARCNDAFKLQAFARHHRDQALMQRLSASLVFRFRFALAVLHQQREHLAKELSGRSSAEIDPMRRIVMAGKQTP